MESTPDTEASICIPKVQLEPDKTPVDTEQLDTDTAEGGSAINGGAPPENTTPEATIQNVDQKHEEEDGSGCIEPQQVTFARSEEDADLRINIGGFSAMVISGVVCHHSPVLRFMCTQHLRSTSTPPAGALALQLDRFDYKRPSSGDVLGDHAVAVLNIESEQCWARDKGKSLSMVLHAMHGNGTKIPHEYVRMEQMGIIAEFTWAYSCEGVMVPWFRIWFDNPTIHEYLDEVLVLADHNEEQLSWFASAITVAFVMKDALALECLLKIFVLLIPHDPEFTKQLKVEGLATQVLESFQDSILAARAKIITEITSIVHHIYDIYVEKPTPQKSPYIEMSSDYLGPCRFSDLGLFLWALENRLPSAGFLLSDLAEMTLSQVFTGLYAACGAIKRRRKDTSSKCGTFSTKADFHRCADLAWFLMDAIVEVQAAIEVPLVGGSHGISAADVPLAALVTPKRNLTELVKRFKILYSEHVHSLFVSPNNGWKYLYFYQWLSKVTGVEIEGVNKILLSTNYSSEEGSFCDSEEDTSSTASDDTPSPKNRRVRTPSPQNRRGGKLGV